MSRERVFANGGDGARVLRVRDVRKPAGDVFETALTSLCEAVAGAVAGEREWLSRVRTGLGAFLMFFDDRPRWRGLLLDHSAMPEGGELALRREQRLLGVLTDLLDDDSPLVLGEVMAEPRLASELVAGGVLAVLRRRLLDGGGGSFVALAGELLAFVIAPYLGEAAAREQLRELACCPVHARGELRSNGRKIDLPIRLTHRTTLVLHAIAAQPGANNRQIAQAAGPIDQGQLSKLLSRLAQRGLIENAAHSPDLSWPNAWSLTPAGERLIGLLSDAPLPPPRTSRERAAR